MKRFLQYGLVILVLLVFAAAFLLVLPGLQTQAKQAAEADLTALAEAAFTRIELSEKLYEEVRASADEAILCRARAASRVIAHDDTLLTTDALSALCEQLDLYLIDVAAPDGEVIGSSEAGYVGTNITEDKTLTWTSAVFEDPTAEYTETDPGDASVRMGCVPRDDSEGVVLVRAKDRGVAAVRDAADPAEVLRQMSFIQDALEIDEGGKEGVSEEDGRFVVRVSRDGTTLAASRPLSSVYTLKNAAILALGVLMLVCLAAAVVIQLLLGRRPRRGGSRRDRGPLPEEIPAPEALPEAEAEQDAPEAAMEPDAPEQATTVPAEDAPQEKPREKKRREKKPRQKIFEFVEVEETETVEPEAAEEPHEAPEPEAQDAPPAQAAEEEAPVEPVQRERRKKPGRKGKAAAEAGENEEGFDKVF